MKDSLKIAALVLCFAVASPLHAERRRAARPLGDALSIEFVSVQSEGTTLMAGGSDAWVDLANISQKAGSNGKSMRIRRQFGIRIRRAGGVTWGSAAVTARLGSPDGRSSVRIDGRPLAAAPVVVDAHALVGVMTVHTLEIEVADSVTAGPLTAAISWEVTTQ
jgi:hypothetical protein